MLNNWKVQWRDINRSDWDIALNDTADLPSARINIKTIRHWISLCLLFMMLLCQVLQTLWFKWWGSSTVNSHLATVDQAALNTRQRRSGRTMMKYWWCKIRLLEVGGEFPLRCGCLSCLQMSLGEQTDVKTSQDLWRIWSVTSKLGSLKGAN